tara:strand:- start:6435 stop:6632 length:198 start_codon:yes stop_codon:yes gene_type:complete
VQGSAGFSARSLTLIDRGFFAAAFLLARETVLAGTKNIFVLMSRGKWMPESGEFTAYRTILFLWK